MNSFYKEQKALMEKALIALNSMEAVGDALKEINRDGKYSNEIVDGFREQKMEGLKTDYALTVTTLMQNFCQQMGFTLKLKEPEFEEAEIV